MTVAAETNLITATANGSQTVFPFTFRILSSSDLVVVGKASNGTETYYTIGTHYTVSGVGAYTGGNVTFLTAPANGTLITVRRVVSSFVQQTDLRNQGAFFAEVHEDVFDLLTMMLQTLKTDSSRALKLRNSEAAAGISTEVPAPESLRVIGWNQAATGLQNIDVGDLAAIPAFISWTQDYFYGDGTTTVFQLSGNPAFRANCDISVNGVTQTSSDCDLVVSSGVASLLFFAPPANGAVIYVRYGQALAASDWPTHAGTHGTGGTDPITPAAIGAAPKYITITSGSSPSISTAGNVYLQFTSALPSAATLPASSNIGAQVAIERAGTGALTIGPAVGVTVLAPGGRLTLAQQYSVAVATLVAANTWRVAGDLV